MKATRKCSFCGKSFVAHKGLTKKLFKNYPIILLSMILQKAS